MLTSLVAARILVSYREAFHMRTILTYDYDKVSLYLYIFLKSHFKTIILTVLLPHDKRHPTHSMMSLPGQASVKGKDVFKNSGKFMAFRQELQIILRHQRKKNLYPYIYTNQNIHTYDETFFILLK